MEAEELLLHSLQYDTDKCSDSDESSALLIALFPYVVFNIIFSPARVFDGLLFPLSLPMNVCCALSALSMIAAIRPPRLPLC